MPTNLPPEYFEADKRFRQAQTPAEKVACLEELISTVPKHKGTDKLRADLRRQLSRLKEEVQAHKKHGGRQPNRLARSLTWSGLSYSKRAAPLSTWLAKSIATSMRI